MGEKKSEHEWINAAVQACIVVAVVFGVIGLIGVYTAVCAASLDTFAYSLAAIASSVFFWGFAGIVSLAVDISRK